MPTRKKLQSRTAMMAVIQKAFALAQRSKQTGIPVDELSDAEKEHAISRRKFLEQSGKATLATILAGSVLLNESFVLPKNKNADIVIVGG
ncbi:MAG: hypothetical protein H7X71_02510, partial [Chitinophagales bacterium]|nr:hypothetical protein [Chitinophagales bacterium]